MAHKTDDFYSLKVRIVTVSSTRSEMDDITGKKMQNLLEGDGLEVSREIIKDDPTEILRAFFCNFNSDVFIYCGGTGPSKNDVTVQSVRKIAEKEMSGFGELFRSRSGGILPYLSNASLFSYGPKEIFCIPGSSQSVDIAYPLIREMIHHLHHELIKE
ncbi:MAG: MogA/MoaB family molybdenum cofactor biosynthesis protein [Candidatus Thermoplasmatota archaeon]|jgi:molybdenum cofactor biosynthesis protein B|nr:MogA/MoaB family molybdenum cofactor biosynthesis protein [Candidatus Thermoplasmatota archaeon]